MFYGSLLRTTAERSEAAQIKGCASSVAELWDYFPEDAVNAQNFRVLKGRLGKLVGVKISSTVFDLHPLLSTVGDEAMWTCGPSWSSCSCDGLVVLRDILVIGPLESIHKIP